MARIYLETSFVSACVSQRTDVGSLYRKEASLRWWNEQAPKSELYISVCLEFGLVPPRILRPDDLLEVAYE